MIARELWTAGFTHVGCYSKPSVSPEVMSDLRNSLGPDALRAESFYTHPTSGRTFGCDSCFMEAKSNVWPVEAIKQHAHA